MPLVSDRCDLGHEVDAHEFYVAGVDSVCADINTRPSVSNLNFFVTLFGHYGHLSGAGSDAQLVHKGSDSPVRYLMGT